MEVKKKYKQISFPEVPFIGNLEIGLYLRPDHNSALASLAGLKFS